jgi:predicted secreted protein
VLPRVAPLGPLAIVASLGPCLVGLLNATDDALVFRTRVAGLLVVATSAALLDDTAAVTLAAAPTTLLTRRSIRVAIIAALIASWWALMLIIADVRITNLPAMALTREVVELTAIAILGALMAQRWSGDGRGGNAGGLLAIAWFLLSLFPGESWMPLPPNPLDPGSTGRLYIAAIAALTAAAMLSRDPAARDRIGGARHSLRGTG